MREGGFVVRRINVVQFLVFFMLFSVALILGIVSVELSARQFLTKIEYGAFWIALIAFLTYIYSIGIYRLYLARFPLKIGAIAESSADEFHYHVYLLFYLILFQPLTRSLLLPVPLMRIVYILLGARLGSNTYSAGTILDPPLTSIGSNTIIGHDALIFSHIIEGRNLSHAPVNIGSNVTVGAKAVIMPGVSIADGAIIGVGAVVRKHTVIGAKEVWVGNPAVRKR